MRTSLHNKRIYAPLVVCLAVAIALCGCVSRPQSGDSAREDGSAAEGQASSSESVASAQSAEVAPPSSSEFMQKVTSGEYGSIRLIGDSITAGFGTDGYEDPNLPEAGPGNVIYDDGAGTVCYETNENANSWANEFRAWARQNGVKSFVNAGISGWFMKQLAQNPAAWIGEGADVIVVGLGTNDAGYYGPDEFAQDARTALEAVEQRCKLVVVLTPVADLRPTDMLVEPAADLGDILKGICEERGYVFVDTRVAVTPGMFCDDNLHPNSEGSHAIWQCLASELGIA